MNITKKKLQNIIKEEMSAVLKEATLTDLGKKLAKNSGGHFTGGFGKSGSTQGNTTEFGSDNYVSFRKSTDRNKAWEQLSAAANRSGEIDGMEAIEHNEYKGAILLKTVFYEMADPEPAIALVSKGNKWARWKPNADR